MTPVIRYMHRVYGITVPYIGRPPAKMHNPGNLLYTIIENNRKAISNEDTKQNIFLISQDGITFNFLKMKNFRIRLIYDQNFIAVDLLGSQKQVRFYLKLTGNSCPVCINMRPVVFGTIAEVQRIVWRSATTSITRCKPGFKRCIYRPIRL